MTLGFHGSPDPLPLAGDDAVRPFAVEALDVRGRAVQIGPALDDILNRHAYPPAVSRLLAEAIVLSVLLGSLLRTASAAARIEDPVARPSSTRITVRPPSSGAGRLPR